MDAAIERVGIGPDGNMGVPKDYWNTAWFEPGVRPGQTGNAVIAGHYDSAVLNSLVVFGYLTELIVGDEVLVETADGLTLRFVVRDTAWYTPHNAPVEKVFGPASTPNLNLVTCGGAFNPATRQYDQRFVVYTTYAGR